MILYAFARLGFPDPDCFWDGRFYGLGIPNSSLNKIFHAGGTMFPQDCCNAQLIGFEHFPDHVRLRLPCVFV